MFLTKNVATLELPQKLLPLHVRPDQLITRFVHEMKLWRHCRNNSLSVRARPGQPSYGECKLHRCTITHYQACILQLVILNVINCLLLLFKVYTKLYSPSERTITLVAVYIRKKNRVIEMLNKTYSKESIATKEPQQN